MADGEHQGRAGRPAGERRYTDGIAMTEAKMESSPPGVGRTATSILESMADAFFALDREWRFTYLNRHGETILGLRSGDLLGVTLWDAFPYLRGTIFEEEYHAAVATGEPRTFEAHSPANRWLEVRVYPSTEGLAVYFSNITARKHSEAALEAALAAEQESRACADLLAAEREAILSQIADGIIIADERGTVIWMNEAAQSIMGCNDVNVALEDHPAAYYLRRLDGTALPVEELPFARALHEGATPACVDLSIERPGRPAVIIEAKSAPVRTPDGRLLGAVASFHDVTEGLLLARHKDDFLAAAAHDLRTPLTTIKGMSQVLQRQARGQPESESLMAGLQRIDATATKMAALINRLLDLTRLQMDQPLDLVRRPIDLLDLVKGAIVDHQSLSDRHILRLHSDTPSLVGSWDVFRIERVLANLLTNAIKYSPNGGEVLILVREKERDGRRWALVSIRDEGIGIPAEALPHLYDRFYRAPNVRATIPGVGIGLTGALQVVQQHGGEIRAESSEGAGATFTVSLPL